MPRRKTSRRSKPAPLDGDGDKLWAALRWTVERRDKDYVLAPFYWDACRAWYARLSPDQRETVSTVIDAFTHFGEIAAERIARSLPPAPRCAF